MPWKETNVMEERLKFIEKMLKNEKPFKHLCAEFEISEKTGHKWKRRYYEGGKQALLDESKSPKTSPNALSEDVIIGIIKLKNAHPSWGPKKIHALYVKLHRSNEVPSLSSVKRVLDKANLVKKRHIKKVKSDGSRLRQHIVPNKSNDVWAIDFKGWWKSGGELCEPLTIRDLHSRYIIDVCLMVSKSSEAVRAVLTEAFKKYGLPKVIRSDNGTPFAAQNSCLSLTQLSAWWITLGILPDRTDKGSPGQNGSLERLHADIANEIENKIIGGIHENQIALDAWRDEYNYIRPNEALGMKTPAEVYIPSKQHYSGDFDEIEYPIGYLPRRVSSRGEITVYGVRITIGRALHGLRIGLKPIGEGKYHVYLADFLLGLLDMDSICFIPFETISP